MKTLFQTWLLTSLVSLQCSTLSLAQPDITNHFDLNVGASVTDGYNVGARYNFGQKAVGVNFGGGLPYDGAWQIISSVSYYHHLWGHSKHTKILPWYLKGAVHFNYAEHQLTRGNFSHYRQAGVRLYLGRDFNISPRIGFSIACGPTLKFFEDWYGVSQRKPYASAGFDLTAFYRLKKL